MPREEKDEHIAELALRDKEAFGELMSRYEAKLGRYLERLGIRGREDREDVLQNAFIKAYRNLNSFDPSLPFSSWIYRIAHNEAMSFFRAKRARPQVTLDEKGQNLLQEIRDETSDTSRLSELRLDSERLARALETLDPAYRDVLALRFFEDRSYTDISDILQIPLGTVSTMIYRAKKQLRTELVKSTHD